MVLAYFMVNVSEYVCESCATEVCTVKVCDINPLVRKQQNIPEPFS